MLAIGLTVAAGHSGTIDIVITDLMMPQTSGMDLLRAAKTIAPETEVILMTAFGSDDVRRQALELGAYGYVEKSPTLASELIALVKAAVAALGGQGGGGRPDMAQGGGPDGSRADEALQAVREALEKVAA